VQTQPVLMPGRLWERSSESRAIGRRAPSRGRWPKIVVSWVGFPLGLLGVAVLGGLGSKTVPLGWSKVKVVSHTISHDSGSLRSSGTMGFISLRQRAEAGGCMDGKGFRQNQAIWTVRSHLEHGSIFMISCPLVFTFDVRHFASVELGRVQLRGRRFYAFRCRTASNRVMIVAIATLSESACPAIGMRTWASLAFSQNSLSPYCSLPITSASGPRQSVSV